MFSIKSDHVDNRAEYIDLLKKTPLLSVFSDNNLGDLVKNSRVRYYKKNTGLFFIEDKIDHFYVIISGCVKLFRETNDGNESVLALLEKDEFFGCVVTLVDSTSYYNAETLEDCTLLEIPTSYVKELATKNNVLEEFLTNVINVKLSHINQLGLQSEHRVMMTSAQRVGCFLLRMCREYEGNKISFALPYDKNMVAARLGMAPETLSRALGSLNSLGVESKGNHVIINDVNQLQKNVCTHCSATVSECSMIKNLR